MAKLAKKRAKIGRPVKHRAATKLVRKRKLREIQPAATRPSNTTRARIKRAVKKVLAKYEMAA